jgi:nuclear pore complex protein Nup98-Nup96
LIPNIVVEHKGKTVVTLDEGRRSIRLRDGFRFSSFASITNIDSNDGLHEQQVWELAGILFDEIEDVPQGLSPEAANAYRSRARKELLSSFWAKLVRPTVETVVETASSPEEKALVYLSGGSIAEACSALLEGRNFHLAQLVAQNRGDQTFRETMAQQLKDWDAIEVVSEMNDCIRTIYHLLAGETAGCGGNPQAGVENRKASFRFSSRFNLGWKRAFGLRLWYGTLEADDIASAVSAFASDLDQGAETARPVPWFVESGEDVGWNDPSPEARQDALWSLLRLYSRLRSGSLGTGSIKALFEPESLSGNPRDARLGFELVNLLKAVGVFGQMSNVGDLESLSAVSDSLAISYADSLAARIPTDPQVLVLACWVLTHVADANAQSTNTRRLLDRFGDILSTNQTTCEALASHDEDGLQIPMAWICSSKAVYAHNVLHDPVAEVRCLIDGGELSRAHDVISQTVGPAAIIENDYGSLNDIVSLIRETDMRKRVDWDKGAGLYFDYAELVHSEKQGAEAKKLVRKLTAALEAVLAEAGKSPAEKVALQMMASSVADIGRTEPVSLGRQTARYWLTMVVA